jgi:mannose-P-dolichol utilization defect protein 1
MSQVTLPDLLQSAFNDLKAGQLPPTSILSLLVSKALGFGILAFSCVVKVPQILAVGRSKSAEGLAPISFELEQVALLIHTAYGYLLSLPFNTYGEAAIICLQNTYLMAQIYKYSKAPLWRSAALTAITAIFISATLTGRVSGDMVNTAYNLNNVIFLAARLPQIYQNFKAGSTGQLSTVTAFANFAGCIARIFTSLQEGGGAAMVRGYILGLFLNGTIFFQILYYSQFKGKKAGESSRQMKKTS